MAISSDVLPHGPLFTVQRSTVVPMGSPETAVLAAFALAKVAAPLTTVHVPTAGAPAALPASVAVDAPQSS